ncbi:MAG: FAD:protein FMN transferase [Deltaproteobacteria bacterium]|nr:FAD:protein FMN transferase [Deltaproteobacteria bacterium]
MVKKRVLVYILITSAVFLVLAIPFFHKNPPKTISYNKILMGTIVEITLREDTARAAEEAFREIERLENIFSSYKETSEVSLVSANAGIKAVKVSREVIDVMETALNIADLSNGAFDPTIGALFGNPARTAGLEGVWDFSGGKNRRGRLVGRQGRLDGRQGQLSGRVPEKNEIEKLVALVNYRAVSIDTASSTISLEKKGMRLDLGGVAKGYIVGKAIDVLKKHGVDWAILRAGGDMTVFGQEKTPPFKIGVQDPRKKDSLIGELSVTNGSIATSGDYERFFIEDGVRYHHIIDPKTGFPANRCRSVTVVSRDPALADALSTAVFVMGPEKGMELIEKLDGVEGVIIDAKGEVRASSGLKGRFKTL